MNDESANDQAMTAEEVRDEMSTDEAVDEDIDFEMLSVWWRRREAKKWTSTVSFFVLFLCVAMTPLLARACCMNRVLHESRARLLQT